MFDFPCLIIFDRISRKSINPDDFWGFFSSILRTNDLSIISVCSQGFGIQTICQHLLTVRFFVTGMRILYGTSSVANFRVFE
ncbi:hypothetical protein Hanom_Chr07g00594081 [Helianthus anomalus]